MYVVPGSTGLFGKVNFPAIPISGLNVVVPPDLVMDMIENWRGARIDRVVAFAQQINGDLRQRVERTSAGQQTSAHCRRATVMSRRCKVSNNTLVSGLDGQLIWNMSRLLP